VTGVRHPEAGGILLFASTSGLDLGSTKSPTGTLSPGLKWLEREAEHSLQLVPSLRKRGASSPLSCTSSQFQLFLIILNNDTKSDCKTASSYISFDNALTL